MWNTQRRTALKVYPGLAGSKAAERAPGREALSDEQLRFSQTERDILEVLDALHVNLRAREAGFPQWDKQVAEFVRNELKNDEDAVEEVRRRVEWHKHRAAVPPARPT